MANTSLSNADEEQMELESIDDVWLSRSSNLSSINITLGASPEIPQGIRTARPLDN